MTFEEQKFDNWALIFGKMICFETNSNDFRSQVSKKVVCLLAKFRLLEAYNLKVNQFQSPSDFL